MHAVRKTKKNLPKNESDVDTVRKERERVAEALVSVLRAMRQDADITQAQIGYALGVSEDVVSNIESLRRPIAIEDAIVWARLAGAELVEFLEEVQFSLRKVYPKP
jgi:hypothetical protein